MGKPPLFNQKPLISVSEARKLLGEDARGLSDNQIEEIINNLSLLAKKYLQNSGSKNKVGTNGHF
jgi:hypothetical protein